MTIMTIVLISVQYIAFILVQDHKQRDLSVTPSFFFHSYPVKSEVRAQSNTVGRLWIFGGEMLENIRVDS